MIFVTGFGQMCNNILQFGHVYVWGKERNVKVIGMRFCYKYPYFKIQRQPIYNWFTYLFAKYGTKAGLIPKVVLHDESSITEENLQPLTTKKYVLIEGWYLRDYDAFLRYRHEIRKLFSFKPGIAKKIQLLLSAIPEATIRVGVHIRRGDYIRWYEGQYYYSDSEYLSVLRSFLKNVTTQKIQFFITSNAKPDIAFFRQELQQEIYQFNGNAAEDLCLLSCCDYIIGPPSTFSLMAAFYNDAPLYWIFDKNKEVHLTSFQKFDYLFRHII